MRVGQARRRDRVEKSIVEALRKAGGHVTRISGQGAPDVLCSYRGTLYAFEIKGKSGTQTTAQVATNWPIVRSVDEALMAIGAIQ